MPEIFVISDTHLGHANILKFERNDGSPLRPFTSLDEMHLAILTNWNKTVTPRDKVYHLGDVAWSQEALKILALCNGKKRLIRGNHDGFKTRTYLQYFDEVYGVRQINGVWLTHVPMHHDSVAETRVKVNIHGHLHAKRIDHGKYFNASVEQINYTPISIDQVLADIGH